MVECLVNLSAGNSVALKAGNLGLMKVDKKAGKLIGR